MTRVLVTGANGFIGRALCHTLTARNVAVRAAVRSPAALPAEVRTVGEIGPSTEWRRVLAHVDTVVHLAGRAHVLHDTAADPLGAYRAVNVAATARLARECAAARVPRLVFVSSIKVNGERSFGVPFTEGDPPEPTDPYGVSKLEAEQELRAIAGSTELEVVVVRPCLVYGPGVRGNLARLLRAIDRGLPLPFASVRNQRSMLGLANLCDLLARCATDPRAAGETFLAADGQDLSTPQLIRWLADGLGRPARLVAVPPSWLELAARLAGASAPYERLCGSLQVDSSKARRLLDWQPPVSPEDGLRETGAWYREHSQ